MTFAKLLSRLLDSAKNKDGTCTRNLGYIKLKYGFTRGRGYSCNRIRCSPPVTSQSLDPPRLVMGMEVVIEKLAIYERTSRLH